MPDPNCQNRGPLLGTLSNRCRIILGPPKGTIILTTIQIEDCEWPGTEMPTVSNY